SIACIVYLGNVCGCQGLSPRKNLNCCRTSCFYSNKPSSVSPLILLVNRRQVAADGYLGRRYADGIHRLCRCATYFDGTGRVLNEIVAHLSRGPIDHRHHSLHCQISLRSILWYDIDQATVPRLQEYVSERP